jgi:hypothetical protein
MGGEKDFFLMLALTEDRGGCGKRLGVSNFIAFLLDACETLALSTGY